jgi:ribosomal protein L29
MLFSEGNTEDSDSEASVHSFKVNPVSETGDGRVTSHGNEEAQPKAPPRTDLTYRETSSNPFLSYMENSAGFGQVREQRATLPLSRPAPSAGDDFHSHQSDVGYRLQDVREKEKEIANLRKELDSMRTLIDTTSVKSKEQCSKLRHELSKVKTKLKTAEVRAHSLVISFINMELESVNSY